MFPQQQQPQFQQMPPIMPTRPEAMRRFEETEELVERRPSPSEVFNTYRSLSVLRTASVLVFVLCIIFLVIDYYRYGETPIYALIGGIVFLALCIVVVVLSSFASGETVDDVCNKLNKLNPLVFAFGLIGLSIYSYGILHTSEELIFQSTLKTALLVVTGMHFFLAVELHSSLARFLKIGEVVTMHPSENFDFDRVVHGYMLKSFLCTLLALVIAVAFICAPYVLRRWVAPESRFLNSIEFNSTYGIVLFGALVLTLVLGLFMLITELRKKEIKVTEVRGKKSGEEL